jgi:sphingomyelin phosphodiesterase 2
LGDFNMVPLSFAHVLIETKGGVKDVWRVLKPSSSVGASIDIAEKERRLKMGEQSSPTTTESLEDHGHTCDSVLNTWRWNKAHRANLAKGVNRQIGADEQDPRAKRLDYVFFGGLESGWKVSKVQVTMTERHPTLLCSLSDHFAVDAIFLATSRASAPSSTLTVSGVLKSPETRRASADVVDMDDKDLRSIKSSQTTHYHLEPQFYQDIIAMIHQYTIRERKQRRYRLAHFGISVFVAIGSWVCIWWSPSNYVSFILLLVSTLGIMAGTIDGLIGGLFVGSELRALAEFEWEIRNALQMAGGPSFDERALRDWYD